MDTAINSLQELARYHSWLTLLVGMLTSLGFIGCGNVVLQLFGIRALGPLRLPLEFVSGVLFVSLVVQVLGMMSLTQTMVMKLTWFSMLALAVPSLMSLLHQMAYTWKWHREGDVNPWVWLPFAAMCILLLVSGMAPESRADETGYHAIVSARVLMDGGLSVYTLPWEATVLPQMSWHFALVPLYAIHGSAAGGVVSAVAAIILALAVGQYVKENTSSQSLAAVASLCVIAQGYSYVFFSTLGPHSFGSLATFMACSAIGWWVLDADSKATELNIVAIAIGCAGMVAGKITMLPLAAGIYLLALQRVWVSDAGMLQRPKVLLVLAGVPVAVLLPLVVWTYAATGSPLGAITAEVFGAARYDAEALDAYRGTRALFENNFMWRFELAYWNLPLIVSAVAALFIGVPKSRRYLWWILAGCQAIVIWLLLPKEIRHFGGVQFAMFAAGFSGLAIYLRNKGRGDRLIAALAATAVVPWLLFVAWISTIYLPLISGLEGPREFLGKYSGLFKEYEVLDKILPDDALILIGRSQSDPKQHAWYARPPIYYAPRPVIFHSGEVPRNARIYMLYVGRGNEGVRGKIPFDPYLPEGYSLGQSVYSNDSAVFYPSRTPRAGGHPARIDVVELVPGS